MINLIETIQKNLGYTGLYKIDPNTQDIKEEEKSFGTNSLAQAAIPAVLCGLFNYILQPGMDNTTLEENSKWLPVLFGNKADEIVDRIAAYAGVSALNTRGEMEHIATEAARLIKGSIEANGGSTTIKDFSIAHKDEALLYLPAALQLGELLGNNSLDDRTHKMEGPISSLMHKFEKQFSGADAK
jgi:hypothetical protein